ncbi:MAG: type II toxin-antitoxin system HicA family toxin [Flavisolibacter sp.]|nr:type II toxin-antitoxin system HicA family toxin [Flavisolibacter sp.]
MNAKQLIKKMEEKGWKFVREGKGSHRIFEHPDYKDPISVPYHGSKDLATGLLQKLLKQAGLK